MTYKDVVIRLPGGSIWFYTLAQVSRKQQVYTEQMFNMN